MKTDKDQSNLEHACLFWLWIAASVLTVLILAVITTAWATRHVLVKSNTMLPLSLAQLIIELADYPNSVRQSVIDLQTIIKGEPSRLLLQRKDIEKPHWVRHFPNAEDTGFLLFSGLDLEARHAVVKLIRISDGLEVARWSPNWPVILEKITSKKYAPLASPIETQAWHPLLLPDGDIIFNTGGAMVRLGTCDSKPVWVLDEISHHSNELDQDGNIWTPSVAQNSFPQNYWLNDRVRDDALAHISADGRLLEIRSFSRILLENDLMTLLFGFSGSKLETDPIHLNQIKVALSESPFWKRGDLLISARHLSTVFLYRPSTGKILWHQTGPWMNQHSVDFVDDHQISVFDNNVISSAPPKYAFMTPTDTNRVLLFDFKNSQISQPYKALLDQERPVTLTAGRARVLPDGGLFVEETAYGRHMRFTRDTLLWSRINDFDQNHIGAVSWSRYLTAEEVGAPLQALAARKCVPK